MNLFKKYYLIISIFTIFLSTSLYAGDQTYKSFTDIGELKYLDTTIEEVTNSPNKFHKGVITIEGKVTKVEYKKYPNGKKFTLFKLSDEKKNNIKVYARGIVDNLSEDTIIRIQGRYSKYKRFLFKKYKNVMKARIIDL